MFFNLLATLYRLQQRDKVEARSLYSSHSGNVYVLQFDSENAAAFSWQIIFAASPTDSNFNAAAIGTWLIDTDAPATFKIKTAATTWVTVTTS